MQTTEQHCELPDSDASHIEADFPIHWQQPPELRNSFSLTLPPRAGVLVPKTQTFFCNLYLLAWFSLTALRVKMYKLYHKRLLVSPLSDAALGTRLWGGSSTRSLLLSLSKHSSPSAQLRGHRRSPKVERGAAAASAKTVAIEWVSIIAEETLRSFPTIL
jgi:hypothetical protein